MQISREADYAVRALIDVAQLPDGRMASTKEIAQRQVIPPATLAKIIHQLARKELLRTERGMYGGVSLGRSATKITLLEILTAIEGPLVLNSCIVYPQECPLNPTCAVHDVWQKAQEEMVRILGGTTLAEAVKRQKEKERAGGGKRKG